METADGVVLVGATWGGGAAPYIATAVGGGGVCAGGASAEGAPEPGGATCGGGSLAFSHAARAKVAPPSAPARSTARAARTDGGTRSERAGSSALQNGHDGAARTWRRHAGQARSDMPER